MSDPTREQIERVLVDYEVECETAAYTHLAPADLGRSVAAVRALFAPALKAARAEGWEEGFGAGWAAQDPDDHEPNPYHQTGEGQ